MAENENNPNWQDKWLGGAMLGIFITTAVGAALLSLANLISDDQTATNVPSVHASKPHPRLAN
jgi:hypothetical protein